ncbi:MAG: hypothetical protein OEW70_08110, partial [candidate division WOR-3 bacterium]|nr:hypothetical protein [candidate division WOR-3 bacterium]
YGEAEKALRSALKIDNSLSVGHVLLGDLFRFQAENYKNQKKRKEAVQYYKNAKAEYQLVQSGDSYYKYASTEAERCRINIDKLKEELWFQEGIRLEDP